MKGREKRSKRGRDGLFRSALLLFFFLSFVSLVLFYQQLSLHFSFMISSLCFYFTFRLFAWGGGVEREKEIVKERERGKERFNDEEWFFFSSLEFFFSSLSRTFFFRWPTLETS